MGNNAKASKPKESKMIQPLDSGDLTFDEMVARMVNADPKKVREMEEKAKLGERKGK